MQNDRLNSGADAKEPPVDDPWGVLFRVANGELSREQARGLERSLGVEFFWKRLDPQFQPDDKIWSPNMAIAWIAFGDLDKVREASERTIVISGFWEKRVNRRLPSDRDMELELVDILGSEIRDFEFYEVAVGMFCEREEKDCLIRNTRAAQELWGAAANGEVTATALKNGQFPPVVIPATEWPYLRFAKDVEPRAHYEKGRLIGVFGPSTIRRTDTLFAPDGSRYLRVRFLANAVTHRWPASEVAADGVDAKHDLQAALDALKRALQDRVANQNDPLPTEVECVEISREIARSHGVYISRDNVRDMRNELNINGKPGPRGPRKITR